MQRDTVVVELGYLCEDHQNRGVQIIHRRNFKTLTTLRQGWLKRRQATEPRIAHTKADHRMDSCWLQGRTGDARQAVNCPLGYNIRWLMRGRCRPKPDGSCRACYKWSL